MQKTKNEDNQDIETLFSTYFRQDVDFRSQYFRIPFCDVTNNGVLIAGGDVRYAGATDFQQIDIGIARSVDFGQSWTDKKKPWTAMSKPLKSIRNMPRSGITGGMLWGTWAAIRKPCTALNRHWSLTRNMPMPGITGDWLLKI